MIRACKHNGSAIIAGRRRGERQSRLQDACTDRAWGMPGHRRCGAAPWARARHCGSATLFNARALCVWGWELARSASRAGVDCDQHSPPGSPPFDAHRTSSARRSPKSIPNRCTHRKRLHLKQPELAKMVLTALVGLLSVLQVSRRRDRRKLINDSEGAQRPQRHGPGGSAGGWPAPTRPLPKDRLQFVHDLILQGHLSRLRPAPPSPAAPSHELRAPPWAGGPLTRAKD